jgi:hypothetical protein
VPQLDVGVAELDERVVFAGLAPTVLVAVVLVVARVPAVPSPAVSVAGVSPLVLTRPGFVHVGEREHELAVEAIGDLAQQRGTNRIAVLQRSPRDSLLRVLVIE